MTKKKAFTLVELLVVIAILGILATVSIIGYSASKDKAARAAALTELSDIRTALIANDLDEAHYDIGTSAITFAVKDAAHCGCETANPAHTASAHEGCTWKEATYYTLADFGSIVGSKAAAKLSYASGVVTYQYSDSVAVTWNIATNVIE